MLPKRTACRLYSVAAAAVLTVLAGPALAQSNGAAKGRSPETNAAAAVTTGEGSKAGGGIERLSGVWVEGGGYDITYGGNYEACENRCLSQAKCRMIEYYRPEKKCNLYDSIRPRLPGGSSNVGIRRAQAPAAKP